MLQHTRQHLPVRGQASVSTARKLRAHAQGPAQVTLTTTVECNDYADSVTVVPCRSKSVQIKCGVTLVPDQVYYMIRSAKFHSRWYVLTRHVQTRQWVCSLRDMQSYCVDQVEQYLAAHTQNVDQERVNRPLLP
jgi:hypothetical protein